MKTYREILEKFETSKDNPLIKAYYDKDKKKVFSVTNLENLSQIHGFDIKGYAKKINAGGLVKIPGTKKNKVLYVEKG